MPMTSTESRRAVVFLFVLTLILAALNMFWTAHEISASNRDRCASLVQLSSIPVPRPVAGHESREFAVRLETAYRSHAIELGCPGVKR